MRERKGQVSCAPKEAEEGRFGKGQGSRREIRPGRHKKGGQPKLTA